MVALTAERLVLWAHVAAGIVAVLAGCVAMVTRKGGDRHRRAGRTFVRSMAVVVGTVLVLLGFAPSSPGRQFLTLVAVFSGYLAFSGYRVLARKRRPGAAETVDWAAAALTALASLGMGAWGLSLVVGGAAFGVVLVVFGALGVGFAGADARSFRAAGASAPEADGSGRAWMGRHLSRMVGAFVATVSAVSVVNLSETLGVVSWLWPTAAFLPLILYWQAKHAGIGPLAGRVGE